MIAALFAFLAVAATSTPIDVGNRKQLFIDERFIAERDRIELRANPPQKLGLLRDEDGKPYQGHIARVIDDGKKARLYLGHENVQALESDDGLTFRRTGAKLSQGLFPTIFLDPHETDPARKSASRRGVIFFDDMDIALRDRDTVKETDDQAVFLSALDGIEANEGVVYVFTTNCALNLIDPAFKRPGRIDLVLHFQKPDAVLRRRLIARWHQEVRDGLDLNEVVSQTSGLSFAEVEELKNLLILGHLERGGWDWDWAMDQFEQNRADLASEARRRVGFGILEPMLNGN